MKLELPRGMRDRPPEEMLALQQVKDLLKGIFELYGYAPLETPIIERFDVLASKYTGGDEILNETFKLTDQGGRELGLRYDLTVPFARFVGMNPAMKMPFKRYHIGTVYRDGPIKLGRTREFYQCDVDVVGTKSMMADAEMVLIALRIMDTLKINATVKVNNRKLLDAIIVASGIPKEKAEQTILSIDKLEKISRKGVLDELKQKGVDAKAAGKVLDVVNVTGDNHARLNAVRTLVKECEGLDEVEQLLRLLADQRVVFEPSLARGLSYYTGTVFELWPQTDKVSCSLAGGGRYDQMIGSLLGHGDFPAVGISFGLEPISILLASQKKRTPTQIYIIPVSKDDDLIRHAVQTAELLRADGIRAEIDLAGKSVSKNLQYASAKGIPFVLFIGPDELEVGKFKLRDMESGKEDLLSMEAVIRGFTDRE
ncbi:MAG: histidine--tRNA ligase [Nanoarchaeota archaeon]